MISNWTWVGMIGGLAFSLFSAARYWVFYPDFDKFIAYVTIGILIMCVSWLYNRQLQQQHTIDSMENYLADKQK